MLAISWRVLPMDRWKSGRSRSRPRNELTDMRGQKMEAVRNVRVSECLPNR